MARRVSQCKLGCRKFSAAETFPKFQSANERHTVARTFGNGAYRQRESLFGAPRGNAVMKAKRVTGDSARTILLRHIALEKCGKCKQAGKVLFTRNPSGTKKERVCTDCLGTMPKTETGCDVVALLSMPTRNHG